MKNNTLEESYQISVEQSKIINKEKYNNIDLNQLFTYLIIADIIFLLLLIIFIRKKMIFMSIILSCILTFVLTATIIIRNKIKNKQNYMNIKTEKEDSNEKEIINIEKKELGNNLEDEENKLEDENDKINFINKKIEDKKVYDEEKEKIKNENNILNEKIKIFEEEKNKFEEEKNKLEINLKEEKSKFEEDKNKFEINFKGEKSKFEEDKNKFEEEKIALDEEKKSFENDKNNLEKEKEIFNEEKANLEEENNQFKEEKVKFEKDKQIYNDNINEFENEKKKLENDKIKLEEDRQELEKLRITLLEKEKLINEKTEEIDKKKKLQDEERINKLKTEMFERQKKLRLNEIKEENNQKININFEDEVKKEIKTKENQRSKNQEDKKKIIKTQEKEKEKEKEKKLNEEKKNIMEKEEENVENKKINEVLEDMCIYGNIIKKEIKEEKEKNEEKYIDINEALKPENENEDGDEGLFALGLLSKELETLGIEAVIDKNEKQLPEEDNNKASSTCLQFIINGFSEKKKYNLTFDFGEERNEELLNDEEEFDKFKNKLKLKLSKDYNIPVNKIIVTFPERGSIKVQVIFQSDTFNDLDLETFKSKFKNENNKDFEELKKIKEIHTDVIMGACKLSKSMLDSRGNRREGWGVGEKRGNKPYDPPIGWIGIGLKVYNEYDKGNNTWIGMNNVEGEWCVAYHGVGRYQDSERVKNITGLIYKGKSFKAGAGQVHATCDDIYHPGKLVGEGVYCTPTIKTAEGYSGISYINGKQYKTVLMVRVKPDAIRGCEDSKDYWVVNGTTEEIRPYRILYKEI